MFSYLHFFSEAIISSKKKKERTKVANCSCSSAMDHRFICLLKAAFHSLLMLQLYLLSSLSTEIGYVCPRVSNGNNLNRAVFKTSKLKVLLCFRATFTFLVNINLWIQSNKKRNQCQLHFTVAHTYNIHSLLSEFPISLLIPHTLRQMQLLEHDIYKRKKEINLSATWFYSSEMLFQNLILQINQNNISQS